MQGPVKVVEEFVSLMEREAVNERLETEYEARLGSRENRGGPEVVAVRVGATVDQDMDEDDCEDAFKGDCG